MMPDTTRQQLYDTVERVAKLAKSVTERVLTRKAQHGLLSKAVSLSWPEIIGRLHSELEM